MGGSQGWIHLCREITSVQFISCATSGKEVRIASVNGSLREAIRPWLSKIPMISPAVVTPDQRQQDLRAKALDEKFDAERRAIGERVAVMFRWIFLAVLGALINLTPITSIQAKDTVDIVLGAWAVMAGVVTVLLFRGFKPGKQFSLSTMVLDILFAAALVYLSDGFNSPYFLALFLSVITNAVRFGAIASVVSAVTVAFIYLFVGGTFTPPTLSSDPNSRVTAFGVVFLFLVVALATGYMTRELERERRQAVRRAAQADQLREVSSDISGDTNIKDVFAVVVAHALQMTGSASASMVLASPDGFAVVATSTSQPLSEGVAPDGLDDSQLAKVARSGEASFSDDKSSMVIPMASNEGITALLSLKRPGQQFSNQDLFAVDALSGSSAVAMANALRYHRSTQEATTDALTGLYNVRELRRRLDAVFARPDKATMSVSLLLIDFDHFKAVNDQHGDLVLQMGARIARNAARAQDIVARYGGDELAILAVDTSGVGAQRLAYRIVDAVHAAAVATAPGKELTFSVGVATYPEDALGALELIAAADQALYLAKREGKDRACTFPQLVTELELADGNLMTMLAEAGPQVVVAAAHAVDHRTAAYLHDVGHMVLSDAQDLEVPGHPEEGERIVAGSHFPLVISAAVRHHHERWDGQGKPDGKAGEEIPKLARILAVAEGYEAMTAGRGCERKTPLGALELVKAGGGSEFDPVLVDALARIVVEGGLDPGLPPTALPAVAGATVRIAAPA